MATALQLCNRVMRELRWEDVTDFSGDLAKVVLDKVNDAVATVFETWDWECDVRHDGVLRTLATRSVTGFSLTAAATAVTRVDAGTIFAISATDQATSPVVQAVFTEDADYGDTSFRVASVENYTTGFTDFEELTLAESFPGTTDASAAITICANEYVMPSTVRKVVSMRHQERCIRLEETNRNQVFDRLVTRPHDTTNDSPDIAMIGARATGTNDTSVAIKVPTSTLTGATGLSVLLYPTPSESYIVNYSYLMQRSDFTATTDTLANVGRAIEALVVKLAFARVMQSAAGDFNPEAGMALEQRALREAVLLHQNQNRDPGRHRVLGSNFSEHNRGVDFGRLPRNFGSTT